eukprot:Sspe_Gene.29936::Locus_14479_Transcript_1_1_Confidence_1.000_Length_939::g.29936::m.29936
MEKNLIFSVGLVVAVLTTPGACQGTCAAPEAFRKLQEACLPVGWVPPATPSREEVEKVIRCADDCKDAAARFFFSVDHPWCREHENYIWGKLFSDVATECLKPAPAKSAGVSPIVVPIIAAAVVVILLIFIIFALWRRNRTPTAKRVLVDGGKTDEMECALLEIADGAEAVGLRRPHPIPATTPVSWKFMPPKGEKGEMKGGGGAFSHFVDGDQSSLGSLEECQFPLRQKASRPPALFLPMVPLQVFPSANTPTTLDSPAGKTDDCDSEASLPAYMIP